MDRNDDVFAEISNVFALMLAQDPGQTCLRKVIFTTAECDDFGRLPSLATDVSSRPEPRLLGGTMQWMWRVRG
jgi:hypothetical protein